MSNDDPRVTLSFSCDARTANQLLALYCLLSDPTADWSGQPWWKYVPNLFYDLAAALRDNLLAHAVDVPQIREMWPEKAVIQELEALFELILDQTLEDIIASWKPASWEEREKGVPPDKLFTFYPRYCRW